MFFDEKLEKLFEKSKQHHCRQAKWTDGFLLFPHPTLSEGYEFLSVSFDGLKFGRMIIIYVGHC